MRLASHRLLFAALLGRLLADSEPVFAAWSPDGVLLCRDHCGDLPHPVPDGAGGAYVRWRFSTVETHGDVYLQHVTAAGEIAPGWTSDLPVATGLWSQQPGGMASDGLGGVIVAWTDYRNVTPGGSGPDIYLQRILSDGSVAPGWTANGVPATQAPGYQDFSRVLGDGSGGTYCTWYETDAYDVYLQHLTATGQPAPGWPANGLPICVLPSLQGGPELASDGAGGVIIAWSDLRDATAAVYAQRVTASGQVLWTENGQRLHLGRGILNLLPDGASGGYFTTATNGPLLHDDYFLHRFTNAGTLAPGWPTEGVPVCTAPDERQSLKLISDGVGGVLLGWSDYREYYDDEVFVQRVRGDGTLFPGWAVDGLQLSHNDGFDTGCSMAPDGLGGAYVCWDREVNYGSQIVQHVTGAGTIAPGWPAEGHELLPGSRGAQVVSDGLGGAIVSWEQCCVQTSIRATRFVADGPVAVEVALVSAEAQPGRVVMIWALAGGFVAADVERRSEDSAWQRLGSAVTEGVDRLRYEDRRVTPGTRYAYRVSWNEGGVRRSSAETWVQVPAAIEFALHGLHPNPAVRDLSVSFSLPSAAPATLELLDVSGRRITSREVGSLGAGDHVLRLDDRAPAPGLYWIRLTQQGRSALARGAVVR